MLSGQAAFISGGQYLVRKCSTEQVTLKRLRVYLFTGLWLDHIASVGGKSGTLMGKLWSPAFSVRFQFCDLLGTWLPELSSPQISHL